MPSSVIAAMHYNPVEATLKIVFVSGMVYQYRNVPESVYMEMKAARSKGKFLNERIKGTYNFDKT